MKCDRCQEGREVKYRVFTENMDIKVCAACAAEARRLHIGIEVLEPEQRRNEQSVE